MKLIYMGSPEPALRPLESLYEKAASLGHTIAAVVSQPARPKGRGQTLEDPPVAAWARAHGIPTLQPAKASEPDFLRALQEIAPDVAITAAYGQILTDAFLAIPKRAVINIHPSLLPAYRGATPVQSALYDGEAVTGVTILFTVKKLDAGHIILQESTAIAPDETAGALLDRTFRIGAAMLPQALELLKNPAFTGTPQDESRVTHCRKFEKQAGLVDWNLPADEVCNRFRAFSPWPGSFTFHEGKRIALTELKADPDEVSRDEPGTVHLDKRHHSLKVITGSGVIHVLRMKPAGGKDINAAAFWNGLKDRSRVVFGGPGAVT